jgi:hypothetical protein
LGTIALSLAVLLCSTGVYASDLAANVALLKLLQDPESAGALSSEGQIRDVGRLVNTLSTALTQTARR